MQIRQAIAYIANQLGTIYDPAESMAIARVLLEHITGNDGGSIRTYDSTTISESQKDELNIKLGRLLQHEPLQHVIGKTWFYRHRFIVTKDVLIPRPETEELVHWALEHLKEKRQPSIIDIGTGSGCIAISLAKEDTDFDVDAIDISENALKVAMDNAIQLSANVRFLQMDILDKEQWQIIKTYDLIISNPPYITVEEKASLASHVLNYEPHVALFVTNHDPLQFYRAIALFGKKHLRQGGKIMVECHSLFAAETEAMFQQCGYKTVLKKDMSGNERMLLANF